MPDPNFPKGHPKWKKSYWPSVRYGRDDDGEPTKVTCASETEVPEGFVDHPTKVPSKEDWLKPKPKKAEKPAAKDKAAAKPKAVAKDPDAEALARVELTLDEVKENLSDLGVEFSDDETVAELVAKLEKELDSGEDGK